MSTPPPVHKPALPSSDESATSDESLGSSTDEPVKGRVLSFRDSLLAVIGLGCVSVMVAVDQTVVGTALPTVVAELKGFELYAWVATAYLLASVVTVPIFGRL